MLVPGKSIVRTGRAGVGKVQHKVTTHECSVRCNGDTISFRYASVTRRNAVRSRSATVTSPPHLSGWYLKQGEIHLLHRLLLVSEVPLSIRVAEDPSRPVDLLWEVFGRYGDILDFRPLPLQSRVGIGVGPAAPRRAVEISNSILCRST